MALLTTAEIREHVETDLTDSALQRVLDAEEQQIIYYCGEHQSQNDRFVNSHDKRVLYPNRRVDSITKVTEYIYPEPNFVGTPTETELSANDYELVDNGRRIDRLPQGDNGRTYWGDIVVVEYTPYDDQKRRKVALIDLVKLSLLNTGALSEDLPDYSFKRPEDIQTERERILFGLRGRWFA
jgi:hypothetical protein